MRRVPGTAYWVGILRGRSAVVLLDDGMHELARLPAPRSTTGLAIGKNGDILVTGELSPVIARYAMRGSTLAPAGEVHVAGVMGLRDVAVSPAGVVWALDERGGNVLRVAPDGKIAARLAVGHGAVQVIATAKHVVVNAVTDHTIHVFATEASGAPSSREPLRITHDGPMWGFDARESNAGLVVAAGGVEDHPLDRTSGFFGYIDSFVFAYRVHDARIENVAAINVSELGVVTPKAIAVESADAEHVELFVTAYGSATGLRASLRSGKEPTTEVVLLLPGIRSLDRAAKTTAMANPLLDAWIAWDEHGLHVVPVANEPPRPAASRLGEALFFTSLMAPKNTSEGALSRFTCETCHFEGYVDGRTHHTGRDDIHATTKPLVGLVGNRPYFSRALDPDLSTVSHAEFRVAGAGSSTDPFFALDPRESREHGGWVEHIGVRERVEPLALRRALLRFLVDFSHRPNSAVVAHAGSAFTEVEREGAVVFRDRCVSCHSARLSADDPSSEVPFDRWEAMILAEPAPIVWGSSGYKKTGVFPYVHTDGARTPSLRRLYKKHPYFTNGSAKSIDDVLDTVRFIDQKTLHARKDPDPAVQATELDVSSKRALRAFLELL